MHVQTESISKLTLQIPLKFAIRTVTGCSAPMATHAWQLHWFRSQTRATAVNYCLVVHLMGPAVHVWVYVWIWKIKKMSGFSKTKNYIVISCLSEQAFHVEENSYMFELFLLQQHLTSTAQICNRSCWAAFLDYAIQPFWIHAAQRSLVR